jgi:hypothetical protein
MTHHIEMISLTPNLHQRPIIFHIAHIEQLVKGKSIFAAENKVGLDVVQLTKETRKCNVAGIIEAGISKDEDSVLKPVRTGRPLP